MVNDMILVQSTQLWTQTRVIDHDMILVQTTGLRTACNVLFELYSQTLQADDDRLMKVLPYPKIYPPPPSPPRRCLVHPAGS